MKRFEYLHTVSFEETNLVGNVYFANHIKWQGICRERFLLAHTPEILIELESGRLALITLHCSCDYLAELRAFDQVLICMYLEEIRQNRVMMRFEYYKLGEEERILAAKGAHEIGCFAKQGEQLLPVALPKGLRAGLEMYRM